MVRMMSASMVIVFLAIMIGGCGSSSLNQGPCKGVTCSGHGSCQVSGTAAACTCVQGYDRDPIDALACIASNPAFVVDLVTGVSSPVDNRITVTLKTEHSIILVMGSALADVWRDMAQLQLDNQKSIAADIDPTSRKIQDLYLPLESPVANLLSETDGIAVELIYSQAVHMLMHSHPRFDAFYAFLQAALASGDDVMITENDTSHAIIDVRAPITP